MFLIARKSVEKADDRGCGNAVRISESDVVKVISVDRGVIRLAHTAFTETREEKESGGETALIPAHSMKEKIPEYRSVPVARCGRRLSASAAHQPTHYPNYIFDTDGQTNKRAKRSFRSSPFSRSLFCYPLGKSIDSIHFFHRRE